MILRCCFFFFAYFLPGSVAFFLLWLFLKRGNFASSDKSFKCPLGGWILRVKYFFIIESVRDERMPYLMIRLLTMSIKILIWQQSIDFALRIVHNSGILHWKPKKINYSDYLHPQLCVRSKSIQATLKLNFSTTKRMFLNRPNQKFWFKIVNGDIQKCIC